MKLEAVKALVAKHGEEWERYALPESMQHAEAVLNYLDQRPTADEIFPFGLNGESLWEPYQKARDRVELYDQGPQEPGLCIDWLTQNDSTLEGGLLTPALPGRCERLVNRECPRLVSMGHEYDHEECNYWAYPGFEKMTPHIELFPEWQRFDCHRFYPLFQATLVLGEMSGGLRKPWTLVVAGGGERTAALVAEYAKLTAQPERLRWEAA